VNDESDLHNEKHSSPRNSTDAGRQIDFNDEQSKSAFDSIRVNFGPDSNFNEHSERHEQKQHALRISMSRFTRTSESEPKYRMTDVP
jgi:hypothetical protein